MRRSTHPHLSALANDWLRGEYLRAAEAIEAQIDPTETEGEAA